MDDTNRHSVRRLLKKHALAGTTPPIELLRLADELGVEGYPAPKKKAAKKPAAKK